MTETLKKTIEEKIILLPKEIQEAIASMDWAKIVEEIGTQYSFTENEINLLQTETVLVLLRLTNLYSFGQNIEENISTSKDAAIKLENEITQKVFKPIADKITENIKKNVTGKETNWNQNIEFILSGGNYFVFLKSADTKKSSINIKITGKDSIPHSKIEDLKDTFTI